VANPYAPIYDAILLVLAVTLASSDGEMLTLWLLPLYLVPWVTQSSAEFLHLQLITIVVAGWGVWLVEKAGKAPLSRFRPREEESTMTTPSTVPSDGAILGSF
jgi:hypothetical protein